MFSISTEALALAQTTTRSISSFVSSVTPSIKAVRVSQASSNRSHGRLLRNPSNFQMILKGCLHIRRRRIPPPDSPPSFHASSNGPTSWLRSNPEDSTCKMWMPLGLPRVQILETMARSTLPMYARILPVPSRVCSLFDQGPRANCQQDYSQARARTEGRW